MRLNPQNPSTVEERRKNRARLESETLRTIRTSLRDALAEIALPEWGEETLEKLVEEKLAESQRIIDALSTPELDDESNLMRHCERVAGEIRSEVRQRIAEDWTEPAKQ